MRTRSTPRLLTRVLCAAACLLLAACGGGGVQPVADGGAPVAGGPAGAGTQPGAVVPGAVVLPGEPTLTGGLRSGPDFDHVAELPLPKQAARAGIDFAADRFIAIFETQPQSAAIAPYLDGDAPGQGTDLVRATDNAPLVQHPFLRKVSVNLGTHYGVTLASRVFYKDVNFAVYTVSGLKDVAELDGLMRRVLHENKGLVREVCYDFIVQAVGGPAAGAPPVFPLAQAARTEAPRRASTPPDYDDPDPYYVNQPGSNTNSGDAGNDSGTWALWRVGATLDEAWSYTVGEPETVIAVVDTGVRYTHEDIADVCINPMTDAPYNAPGVITDTINRDNDPADDHAHGTFCAGEIGCEGNNGLGLAGVCWNATLLPVKVLSGSGYGTDAQVAEGMLAADYLGADIISMSLGGLYGERSMQLACKQCDADGVLILAAAGNSNFSIPFYPAYYPECVAVGGTTLVNSSDNQDFGLDSGVLPIDTRYDAKVGFSCYGPWVDVAAPSVLSLSIGHGGDNWYYAGWQGTSMACPIAAGVAGLIWSHIDDPDNNKVRGLLMGGATEMTHLHNGSDPKGFLNHTSNGTTRFVNAYQSILLYETGYTEPTVTWDNPVDGATVSGVEELRVSVSGGSGDVREVEFETFGRFLGTQTAPSSGFYRQDWDSAFEFNRPIELRAKVYDDAGGFVISTITVTPDNDHAIPGWLEDFDDLAANELPGDWYQLVGNQGSSHTQWGADTAQFFSGARSMHTSGTVANYNGGSQDYLYAPILDLRGFAAASLSFKRRYQMGGGARVYLMFTLDDRTFSWNPFGDNGSGGDDTSFHDWGDATYDLSGYAGQEVRAIFALDSGGGAPGLWLDDIGLTSAAGTGPTVSIDTPAAGASVDGVAAVTVTVSDDTEWISLYAEPPGLTSQWYDTIPDNDLESPTKTFTMDWDSRHTYSGAATLTVTAWDDEDGDDNPDDFSAVDTVSVSVTNPTRDAVWHEGFEAIGTLGGIEDGVFDGDWYVYNPGTNVWRVTGTAGQFRSGAAGCRFGPSGGGNYGASDFGLLYSPVHDLTGATRPYLRFWQQIDVEAGGGDLARLNLIQYSGLDETRIPVSDLTADTTPAGEWKEVDIDLSRWIGKPVRFNFLFRADGDADAGLGWLLDDYEVLDADPQITTLTPARGVADGDTQITIAGLRFGSVQGTSTVTFAKSGGGRTAAEIVSWSNTSVVVKVPADAVSGDVVLNVLGWDSPGSDFRVVLPAPVGAGLGQH